jgi:phosphotransferase system IIB component
MSERDLAQRLLELVGGAANVQEVRRCMVRLRFVLRDSALADDAGLQALPEVLLVVRQSGQLQLALGVPLTTAFRDVQGLLATSPDDGDGSER